jgi:hypothetical protein
MKTKKIKSAIIRSLAVIVAVGGILVAPAIVNAAGDAYNEGTYGSCSYNSCGITYGTSPTVAIDVTPAAGVTTCSVNNGEIQVLTDSSTGYTISMTDTDTDTNLKNGGSGSIATTSGTSASPTALTANKWGYRVDGINGFGAGPTSTNSNGAIPSVNFAAIPASSATPDIIATTTTPADPYVSTYVWYGLCANSTPPSGAYSDSITYTVVVN